jgi:anthranilate/para-aminobenzoate synthase component I
MPPAPCCSTAVGPAPTVVGMTCSAPSRWSNWRCCLTKAVVDFLQRLRTVLTRLGEAQLPAEYELPFAGGLIGYLSYDFGRHLEHLPSQARDDLQLPDARFGLYDWALVSDHQKGTSQLVFHPSINESEKSAAD